MSSKRIVEWTLSKSGFLQMIGTPTTHTPVFWKDGDDNENDATDADNDRRHHRDSYHYDRLLDHRVSLHEVPTNSDIQMIAPHVPLLRAALLLCVIPGGEEVAMKLLSDFYNYDDHGPVKYSEDQIRAMCHRMMRRMEFTSTHPSFINNTEDVFPVDEPVKYTAWLLESIVHDLVQTKRLTPLAEHPIMMRIFDRMKPILRETGFKVDPFILFAHRDQSFESDPHTRGLDDVCMLYLTVLSPYWNTLWPALHRCWLRLPTGSSQLQLQLAHTNTDIDTDTDSVEAQTVVAAVRQSLLNEYRRDTMEIITWMCIECDDHCFDSDGDENTSEFDDEHSEHISQGDHSDIDHAGEITEYEVENQYIDIPL